MRTLIILRHAKSSWATPGMDDFNRPLNERGRNDAPCMGAWLTSQHLVPDQILCSPSRRTRETTDLLFSTLSASPAIQVEDDFYHASPQTLLKAISQLDSDVKTAALVAHNPGLHDASLDFLTEDERRNAGNLRSAFPTAACAIITLPIDDWSDIQWGIGALISYMTPKALNATKLPEFD